MAKEAVYQVRMDAEMKEKVEQLYRKMGSSFADAIRMFAAQSLLEQGMPFTPTASTGKAFGIAAKRANPALIPAEEGAFARGIVEKYAAD